MMDENHVKQFLLQLHNHTLEYKEDSIDCINMKRICRAYLKCYQNTGGFDVHNKINMRARTEHIHNIDYKKEYINILRTMFSVRSCMEIWNDSAKWHLSFKDLSPEEITYNSCMKSFTEYVLDIIKKGG